MFRFQTKTTSPDRLPSAKALLHCEFAATHVAEATGLRTHEIFSNTRSRANVASARQIAMYLAHTLLELSMTEVGACFARDRTTVRHACAAVEDSRDAGETDCWIAAIEAGILSDLGRSPVRSVQGGDAHVR